MFQFPAAWLPVKQLRLWNLFLVFIGIDVVGQKMKWYLSVSMFDVLMLRSYTDRWGHFYSVMLNCQRVCIYINLLHCTFQTGYYKSKICFFLLLLFDHFILEKIVRDKHCLTPIKAEYFNILFHHVHLLVNIKPYYVVLCVFLYKSFFALNSWLKPSGFVGHPFKSHPAGSLLTLTRRLFWEISFPFVSMGSISCKYDIMTIPKLSVWTKMKAS